MTTRSMMRKRKGVVERKDGYSAMADVSMMKDIVTESDFERHFSAVRRRKDASSAYRLDVRRTCRTWIPVCSWLPNYEIKTQIGRDIMVGVTLAFVIAPKAMAHALLEEVSPVHGLYTAFTATVAYGTMGNVPLLSIGTCALPALMFGEALSVAISENNYDAAAPTLTFLIGIISAIMSLLRLEVLTNFIPPCALSAFTTTAAFLIGTSQVKYMLGLDFKADGFVQTWIAVLENAADVNGPTLAISAIGITFLVLCKVFIRRAFPNVPNPGPMILVLLSTIASFVFNLESHGVDVVGNAPVGLVVSMPDPSLFPRFFESALIIAVVNYVLTTSIAKSMSAKSGDTTIDSSQELRALSAANILGGCFAGIVAGGSFSGSAIIASIGSKSMMHNFVNSSIMLLIVTVVLPLLAPLPKATLGAIIVVALPRLIDFSVAWTYYRVKRDDFLLWLVTLTTTLFLGVQIGLIVALTASILALIRRASVGHVVELGRLPGTVIYRSIRRFPDANRLVVSTNDDDRLIPFRIFRLDSSVHFGNSERIEAELIRELQHLHLQLSVSSSSSERVQTALPTLEKQSTSTSDVDSKMTSTTENDRDDNTEAKISDASDPLTQFYLNLNDSNVSAVVVLSCVAVNFLDTAGISMLTRFARRCRARHVELFFSGWKASCRSTLYRFAKEEMKKSNASREKRSGRATTTPANAPTRAIARLTNSRDAVELDVMPPNASESVETSSDATPTTCVTTVEESKGKQEDAPSPLDPSRWFLALHNAAIRFDAIELQDVESDVSDERQGGIRVMAEIDPRTHAEVREHPLAIREYLEGSS